MFFKIVSCLFCLRNLFAWRVESEIYYCIFPHLRKERDFGYPFQSKEELAQLIEREHAQAAATLERIRRDSPQMPQAYGLAFRHIMNRDINERLKKYEALMRSCIRPEPDPRHFARRANV